MRRRILIRRRIILKIDEVKREKGNFRMKTRLVKISLSPVDLRETSAFRSGNFIHESAELSLIRSRNTTKIPNLRCILHKFPGPGW